MLKRKALRKIVVTTFSIITIFIICIIPSRLNLKDEYLNPNIETIYVTNLESNEIYLLADNNYLTKTSVILNDEEIEDKIKDIIEYLIIDKSSKIPQGLKGIIPKNTIIKSINIADGIVTLDFSSELLKTSKDKERKVIEGINYSLINLDGIEGVKIKIDNKILTELPQTEEKIPQILNRNFGINKIYEIKEIKDTKKVVTYYINEINNTTYYVPVTKYLNDDREKIKIIIDNLASNYIYEPTLMSLLSQDTKLLNYELENSTMNINLSNSVLSNDNILEEVIYQITESVFENYDVDKINIQINNEEIVEINKCCGIIKKKD